MGVSPSVDRATDARAKDLGQKRGRWNVKLLKRFAVAMGSLLALAFAGGAHIRW